jgi:hypothetical protein
MSELQTTRVIPPSPAAVAEYFVRRRSRISAFIREDIECNERLWKQLCRRRTPMKSETLSQ